MIHRPPSRRLEQARRRAPLPRPNLDHVTQTQVGAGDRAIRAVNQRARQRILHDEKSSQQPLGADALRGGQHGVAAENRAD